MPEDGFCLPDDPIESSVNLLVVRLRDDSAARGVSAKNYAHRSRVIRQQTALLDKRLEADAAETETSDQRRLFGRHPVPLITAKSGDKG